MARVLLVADETVTRDLIKRSLKEVGHDIRVAPSQPATKAVVGGVEVAVVDSALVGISGLDVVRQMRRSAPWVNCIVFGEALTAQPVIEAMRAGAVDWLYKPVCEKDVQEAVKRACNIDGDGADEPHALRRLAEKAVLFMSSPEDKTTLRDVGRVVGVSSGGLRNWCRTAKIKARAFRQFARGLRAVCRQQSNQALSVENIVDIVDRRSLIKFVAGSGGATESLPSTIDEFLARQSFIANPRAVDAVRRALRVHQQ